MLIITHITVTILLALLLAIIIATIVTVRLMISNTKGACTQIVCTLVPHSTYLGSTLMPV